MREPDEPGDAARRFARAQELFHAALERPEPARAAFVREACGTDAALAARVLDLLAADREGHALLDAGLGAAADAVLGAGEAALPAHAFGPYRVTGVLGEGGMGVVFRARRDDLGSDAAIKILRDAALSPARRERFAFEQRVLARLNHPNIARLYDADVLPGGTPWFAMELVEGVPITAYCRERRLPVDAILRLFLDVCVAVRHAHAHALIHRDLKPTNILVRADGVVKLVDFGIAKSLEALADGTDATRTGLRLMTPAYASPEQVRGADLGVHTDVYSLGVVLYELLAGRLPFDLAGLSPSESATRLLAGPPRRPSTAAGGAPAPAASAHARIGRGAWNDLDVLCLTAMHADPARRYRTVDALARDVERFLAGEPLDARGDSFRYRTGKFVKRHAGPVITAAAVLVALVAIVTFYTLRLAEARDRARAEAARRKATQETLFGLLQGGDAEAGPQDTLRVVTLVRLGEDKARTMGAQPELQAQLEGTLGGIEAGLGQFQRADTLLARALAHTLALPGASLEDRVASLDQLAALRADEARHDEAEALARRAVALAEQAGPEGQALRAQATFRLGYVLEARGAYAAAIPLFEQVLRASRGDGSLTPEAESAITELADTHYQLGHYDVSDSLNHIVLDADRRRVGPRHPAVAEDLLNIASIHSDLGRYPQAEREIREALAIERGWYGEDHRETAACLGKLAAVLVFEGRNDEAARLLPEALTIEQHVYGPVHPRVAVRLGALGSLALSRDRYDEATGYFDRSLAIYRALYGDHGEGAGVMLANLGSVELRRNRDVQAERWFRSALEAYRGVLPDDHRDVAVTRVKLGRALLHQRRFAEAERASRAGYDVLVRNSDPALSFLRAARKDLAADYAALGRDAEAARFRAELADTTARK